MKADGIKIKPLAGESLGTRSMALKIEVDGFSILLDPSTDLGPRFNLPPHKKEIEAQINAFKRILKEAKDANFVFISHYHWDHYIPTEPTIYNQIDKFDVDLRKEIYSNKILFIKDNKNNINESQKERARSLFNKFKNLFICDGKEFDFGDFKLEFSKPFPHGKEKTSLGFVVGCCIKAGDFSLVYMPDVCGPLEEKVVNWILEKKPKIAIIGGFPEYHKRIYTKEDLERAVKNMKKLVENIEICVFEHHLLRSFEGLKILREVDKYAREFGNKALCYADLLKEEPNLLEARRKELYEKFP